MKLNIVSIIYLYYFVPVADKPTSSFPISVTTATTGGIYSFFVCLFVFEGKKEDV